MRTTFLLSALTLVFGFGLGGCATGEKSLAEKGVKPLTEAELKSMHSRARSIQWTNARNATGTSEYRADGTSTVNWGTGSAQGKYRIVGNTFCTQYPEVRGGAENCSRVYKVGDNEYRSYLGNGEYNATFSYIN